MSPELSAERYVAGGMDPEELAAFEARMLAEPVLAADVDVRQRIRAGLERLQQRGELAPMLEGGATRPRSARYAIAASIAAGLLIAAFVTWRGTPQPASLAALLTSEQAASANIGDSFMIAQTRGSAPPQEIHLPPGGDTAPLVELKVIPDGASEGPFRVQLANAEVTARAGADGFVTVYLRPAGLVSGPYVLTVTPSKGAQQRFALALTHTP